ncbi:MAG: hypothetical protein HN855_02830 [Anaerolineae bacterium]|jgi:dienelactone hydrolase|nr:hypothetical protein [Anaerolineae bacterium]MBT7072838.1 hypothetical protein [Anaerolineae bacterium]MBT7324072.1 hypothetical protein [Anaerolineae bacterium]
MRPFELTLSIFTILVAISYFLPLLSDSLKYKTLPIVLVLLAGTQLLFEGFRWQLWPLFIGILLLVIIAVMQSSNLGASMTIGFSILLAVISIVGGKLLPVPKAYKITGPYQVGTTVAHLTDSSRQEIYGDDATAPREIMVQVWYPAEPTRDNERSQWMQDIKSAAPAIATYIDLPSFALNHLKYVKGNAFIDAPPIDGNESPVLVFSHGWAGFKEQNIFQVEELASHGYTVVAINHTHGAILTVFPDGREVPRNPNALPSGVPQAEYDLASNLLVRQWADDMAFVLDELERTGADSTLGLLTGKIDLEQVGIFGHSTGAAATVEFCATDPRCKAALVMDLWSEPLSTDAISAGLSHPIMLMHSENWDLDDPARNYGLIGDLLDASTGEFFEFTIRDTKHYDFSSLPLLSPLTVALGLKGPIEGDLGLEIINFYSVHFFDEYLQGNAEYDWADLSMKYPEAMFGFRP